MARILIADHLAERRNVLCTFLRGEEHLIIPAAGEEEALKFLRDLHPELVIGEGTVRGAKLLTEVREFDAAIAFIMIMAGPPTVEQVVKLMEQGVSDILVSPLDINDVQSKVERALSQQPALEALQIRFRNLVGSGVKMQRLFHRMIKIATVDTPVLIVGEKGTGKQSVATELHHLSVRRDRPFLVVRCAGLAAWEVESELFGHEPGAFAGALERRQGQLELGDSGMLYLEEVGALSLPVQAKLLRFLEQQTLQRLGGGKPLSADVRILAGAAAPLIHLVQDGTFRSDLYYRLSTNLIELPPLRRRANDIPELVDYFLSRYDVRIAGEAMEVMMNYAWPGNLDELKNTVDQAVSLCDNNRVELKDLPPRVLKAIATGNRRYKFIPRSKASD